MSRHQPFKFTELVSNRQKPYISPDHALVLVQHVLSKSTISNQVSAGHLLYLAHTWGALPSLECPPGMQSLISS